MSKVGMVIKLVGTAVTTTTALLAVLRENPQLQAGVEAAIAKIASATDRERPKARLLATLTAIDAAASAVEELDPDSTEPAAWRRQASALRVRGDLAWNATAGRARRQAMKGLTAETSELLSEINAHLAGLQAIPIDVKMIEDQKQA